MTNLHTTPPLAQTIRGYITHAPANWRAHMAAAADQVVECARLRAENDELREISSARGYAHLGIGAYIINHSAAGNPAELCITLASDEDRATRTVGDNADNPPDAEPIPAEEMVVRLRFASAAGLDALKAQLAWVRTVHFASSAADETLAAPGSRADMEFRADALRATVAEQLRAIDSAGEK